MAKIIGYIASSLDGFIATSDDKLDWLFQYNDMDLGKHDYKLFIKRIQTVVMGRGTYDFIANDPTPWAYGDKRVLVVTSHPIDHPKGKLEVRSDIDDLITELRAWRMGMYGCLAVDSYKWRFWKEMHWMKLKSISCPNYWAVGVRCSPLQDIMAVQN